MAGQGVLDPDSSPRHIEETRPTRRDWIVVIQAQSRLAPKEMREPEAPGRDGGDDAMAARFESQLNLDTWNYKV